MPLLVATGLLGAFTGFLAGVFTASLGILLGAYLFKAHPEILERVRKLAPRKKMKIFSPAEESALDDLAEAGLKETDLEVTENL